MPYGYDPKDYMQDFSWIGQIGSVIAATANKFPEILELNRKIKHEDNAKEQIFSAVNQYIDSMDDSKLSNIASSMDIRAENSQQMREKLKRIIPKPMMGSGKEDNGVYSKDVVDKFFVPFITAAKSQRGGGSLNFGELFGSLQSGQLQKDILQESRVSQDEQFQRRLTEQPQLAAETQRQVGGVQQEQRAAAEQAQFDLDRERGQKSADIVSGALASAPTDPISALTKAVEGGATLKEAQQAYDLAMGERDSQERRQNAVRMYGSKVLQEKEIDKFRSLKFVEGAETDIAGAIQDLEVNKTNASTKEKVLIQQQIDKAKENLKKMSIRRKEFIKKGDFTTEGIAESTKKAETVYTQETAQEMVDAFNSGEYRDLWKSREAEKQDFTKAFKKKFGVDPIFNETGNKYAKNTATSPYGSSTSDMTQKKAQAKNALPQLKAALNDPKYASKKAEIQKKIADIERLLGQR